MTTLSFPRKHYEALLIDLFPIGSTISWKGTSEPFHNAIGEGTPITVEVNIGDFQNEGTSENSFDVQSNGTLQTTVSERGIWPLTIRCNTTDPDLRGADVLMQTRLALRFPPNIQRLQGMGLSTVHLGQVITIPVVHGLAMTFEAVLEITHGQCLSAVVPGDPGYAIERFDGFTGTVTEGVPSPLTMVIPGNG